MAWMGRNPIVDEALPPGGPVTSSEPVLGGAEGVSPTAKLVWDLARALLSQNPATTAGPQVGVVTGPMRGSLQSILPPSVFSKLERNPTIFHQVIGQPDTGSNAVTGTLRQWAGLSPDPSQSLRPNDVITVFGPRLSPTGLADASLRDAAIHESLHNLYKGRAATQGLDPSVMPLGAFPSQRPSVLAALNDFYVQRGLLAPNRALEIGINLRRDAPLRDLGESVIEGMTNMILQRQGLLGASKFARPQGVPQRIPSADPAEWSRRTAEWLKTRYPTPPTTGGTPP